MSTATLEDVETKDAGTDAPDEYAHYFRKADLDRALFEGIEIKALCGKAARPLRGVEGRSVCPECKDIYEDNDRILRHE